MARRQKRIEHDNHDRWLISYADFVTLLFAFFVVMYSISSVNEGKYKSFSNSLNIAFSQQPGSTQIVVTPDQPAAASQDKVLVDKRTALLGRQQRKLQEQMTALDKGLRDVMSPLIEQGQVGIYQKRRGVVVDISASTLFKEGEAIVQPSAMEVLLEVANVLGKDGYPVEVEGHTDDVPIKTAQFPSNWELSSGRASSVVRVLIAYGVAEKRLAAVGMAANQPLVENDTLEHRAKNRRVTITILSPVFDRLSQSGDAGGDLGN